MEIGILFLLEAPHKVIRIDFAGITRSRDNPTAEI